MESAKPKQGYVGKVGEPLTARDSCLRGGRYAFGFFHDGLLTRSEAFELPRGSEAALVSAVRTAQMITRKRRQQTRESVRKQRGHSLPAAEPHQKNSLRVGAESLAARSDGSFEITSLIAPRVSRHDSMHEFIEEGYREGGVAVVWAPNHALGDQLIAGRPQLGHLAFQFLRDVT